MGDAFKKTKSFKAGSHGIGTVFPNMDVDGSGRLDFKEFHDGILGLGFQFSEKDIHKIFQDLCSRLNFFQKIFTQNHACLVDMNRRKKGHKFLKNF